MSGAKLPERIRTALRLVPCPDIGLCGEGTRCPRHDAFRALGDLERDRAALLAACEKIEAYVSEQGVDDTSDEWTQGFADCASEVRKYARAAIRAAREGGGK